MTAVIRGSLSKLSPRAGLGIFHYAALHHVHDRYHARFVDDPSYTTVARSDPDLKSGILEKHNVDVNAAKFSDAELLEAILLCRSSSVFRRGWKELDRECCKRMSRLSFHTTVQIMDSWLTGLGSRAFRGEYYAYAIAYWVLHLRFAKKEEFVHLLYLLGQKKSVPDNLAGTLQTALRRFLPSLGARELAVVCNGLFKLKCKVFDRAVLDRVAVEAEELMLGGEDSFDLISLLKFLRMCKYYNEALLAKLTTYILERCDGPNVAECAHYLAAYSSVNVYERNVFEKLETLAFSSLKCFCEKGAKTDSKAHPAVAPRLKDVAKVLWALANVGHRVSSSNLTDAVHFIENNFNREAISHVLDALQSLACLGSYPRNLIYRACSSVAEGDLVRHPKKKLFQQYVFVKNSALIMLSAERPPLLLASHVSDGSIGHRSSLASFVEMYSSEGLRPSYVLPHVRIAGVALLVSPTSFTPASSLEELLSSSKKAVRVSDDMLQALVGRSRSDAGTDKHGDFSAQICHVPVSIEVLDPEVTVRNSSVSLLGVMRAKLDQLHALGVRVVLVTPCCVESLARLEQGRRRAWLDKVLKDCTRPSQTERLYSSQSV